MSQLNQPPLPFAGREFSSADLELIRQITSDFAGLGITEIARTACELLEWKRPSGGAPARLGRGGRRAPNVANRKRRLPARPESGNRYGWR